MSQINLPITLPRSFRNTNLGRVHQKVVAKAQDIRQKSEESIDELKSSDGSEVFDGKFGSWNDLSPKAGVVTMVRREEGKYISSARLSYDKDSGSVESLVLESSEGKLRRQSDSELRADEQPTYSWETGMDSETNHTLLRFNDKLGTISLLDQSDNESLLLGILDDKDTADLKQLSVPGAAPLPWI